MLKNQKDFWAGILFAILGIVTVVLAQEHPMGTLSRMGPSYFPTILGCALALIGVIVAIKAFIVKPADGTSGRIDEVKWGVFLFILLGPAAFAVALLPLGIVLAVFLLVAVSSFADPKTSKKEIVILSIIVSVLIWLLFVYGIGLQVPVFPEFLTN